MAASATMAMRMNSVGNLLALNLLRRRHSLGQVLPRYSELWNKNTLRGGLLLLIHIYTSFIIQALSVLNVMPRFMRRNSNSSTEEQEGILRDHLVQYPSFIDKGILFPVYYQVTFIR